jgi:hypothetical protein
MKQYQVILLLVIPIVAVGATLAIVVMTTMSNSVLAQTGNLVPAKS